MKKRGDIYYHQCRVPVDLQELLGQAWINQSLKLKGQADAERAEMRLLTQLEDLFSQLRVEPHTCHQARTKLAKILCRKPPVLPDPATNTVDGPPKQSGSLSKPRKRGKEYRLRQLFAEYENEHRSGWSIRSKRELPNIHERIIDHFNNPKIKAIERAQVVEWVHKMENIDGLAPKTVKKYVTQLSAALSYAHQPLGLISVNPALKVKRKKDRRKNHEIRAAYTPVEATKLFTDLQSCKAFFYADAHHERYWVPLLLAYTGARVNEICQLRVDNVIVDETGVPYISIQLPEDDRDINAVLEQILSQYSLKTDNSARDIPIHRDLLALGFLSYVERVRAHGFTQLFPALRHGPNGFSHYFVSRWTSKSKTGERWYATVLGDDTEKGNHNWRHTFINKLKQGLLRDELMEEAAVNEVSGLANSGEAMTRYGKRFYLESMLDIIHRHIRYDFMPTLETVTADLYEDTGETDEYGEAIESRTGLAVTYYCCGDIKICSEPHHPAEEPSVETLRAFQRPDLYGYSPLHKAITDFWPEPDLNQLNFTPVDRRKQAIAKSKRPDRTA